MPVGDILKQNKYLLLISFACLIFLSNNNLIIAEVSKWDYNPTGNITYINQTIINMTGNPFTFSSILLIKADNCSG